MEKQLLHCFDLMISFKNSKLPNQTWAMQETLLSWVRATFYQSLMKPCWRMPVTEELMRVTIGSFFRGEELCCSMCTTTINETKKHCVNTHWEKLLKYRSNSFILSFLSIFLYVKLLVQRNPPLTWPAHHTDHARRRGVASGSGRWPCSHRLILPNQKNQSHPQRGFHCLFLST